MKKILLIVLMSLMTPLCAQETDRVTGLVIDEGLDDIKEHCTVCHTGRFMVINGGDKKFWSYKITLMQKGFGLWDVEPASMDRMLNYLAKNYSKKESVSINE